MTTVTTPATDDRPVTELLDLTGEVALVTGGATGIGRQIVARLAEAGAKVHVVDLADRPADVPASVGWHVADVQDADRAREVCDAVEELSIVVANAGWYELADLDEADPAVWDKALGINLFGTLNYARAGAAAMRRGGREGRIVTLSSTAAIETTPMLAHYGAAKAAVGHLTTSLAVEYGPSGIRVNAIAPGGIMTERALAVGRDAQAAGRPNLGHRPRPLGDVGTVDDIARAVLFLVGPLGRYVTGAVLVVDGGVTLV